MIHQLYKAQEFRESAPSKIRDFIRLWIPPLRDLFKKDLSALLISTAIFEVTSNVVYVMFMERVFDLGRGASSVGVFLIIQAGSQLILSPFVGSLADSLGARRAGIFGLVSQVSIALGLAYTKSIEVIYLLAFLITVARLFVITSRLPLVTQLCERTIYLRTNTAIAVLTGMGLFVGPAIGATLYLLWQDPSLPFIISAGLFLLAAIPLLFVAYPEMGQESMRRKSVLEEVRVGWNHILNHHPIWEVLACLSISSITFGAIMPMLTLLAKHVGLGMEGSGIFVAALGLGWMLGPLASRILIHRMSYTLALLLTGLITPIAALSIGVISSVSGILIALTVAAFAGASLNVIVISIIQRLTPDKRQGSVIGAQQALSGLVWILSVASITGVLSAAPPNFDPRGLFIPIGIIAVFLVLVCWFYGRRTLSW